MNIELVFNILERACKIKGYGMNIGAHEFFRVSDINELINSVQENDECKRIDRKESVLSFPVDDIGNLCKKSIVEWAENEGKKRLAERCSDYFTEHDDGKGVRLCCFDKEYNFGKKAAEQMSRELAEIVSKWGDSK